MNEPPEKKDYILNGDAPRSSFIGISELFSRKAFHEHKNEFLMELAYHNFTRVRMMVLSVLIICVLLLFLDAFQFLNGKLAESLGQRIIALFHAVLFVFLCGMLVIVWKRKPDSPDGITFLHRAVTDISICFGMLCLTLISIGDVLSNGSTVAYLGTVFAYAAIFLMTDRYAVLLFGINMVLMLTLLILVRIFGGQNIDVQLINVSAFTVVAFVLSRILYRHSRKDFSNRLLIKKQNIEINRKNDEKEALIRDLQSALNEVKTLSGFLPICASCKKIRDDKGYWSQIENYISEHSDAEFSHSICPECAKKLYPGVDLKAAIFMNKKQ